MTPTTPRPDAGERLFRALLLLYPARFRERFGDEMVAFYRDRRREARHRGGLLGVVRLWLHLALDVGRSAPREHGTRLRAAVRSAPAAGVEPRDARPGDAPSSSPAYPTPYPEHGGFMDALRQDLRFAVRTLIRRPGFAAVAVLTLALGIGANTAIFSVVHAVLLRPLPWPGPDRLVLVHGTRGAQGQQAVAYQDFLDWRRETSSFAELGVVRFQSVNLTGGDTPDRLIGTFATANVLRLLGATAARGRLFTEEETELGTRQPVAVVSDAAWRGRFGARPDLVGSTLVLNGEPFTVIGILPAGLQVPLGAPDVWMPIGYYPNKGDLQERGRGGVMAVGRLRPGVTRDAAQADLAAVTRRLAERYPTTNAEVGADVQPLRNEIVGPVRTPLLLMLSAVAIVLLIACANVANLQLARAAARRRELSVRAALGAGRARLMRQLLTESLVLSLLGGLAGVLLAYWGVKALAAVAADNLPVYGAVTLERPVLLFALGITAAAGLLFGVVPAWQASRADLQESLTQRVDGAAAGGRLGARNVLVVGQLALCVVLLVSAGLLTRSLAALAAVKPGFDPEHLLTLQFRLPPAKYATEARIADMFARTLAEIRGVPGVRAAALVRATPLNGNGERFPYATDRSGPDARQSPMLQLNIVSPGYFETMAIPRIAGRDFADGDRAGALPVAIVSDRLAKRAWPNESPIGKRIRIGADSTAWATVVGVVGTVKHFRLTEEPLDQAYVPYMQRPLIFTEVVVRAEGDPLHLANAVRAAVWRVDRDQPVWRVRSMDQVLRESLSAPTLTMGLITGFAVLAMLLAAIGVYGVTSFLVARRTREVGIRMALGAKRAQVLGMVMRQGMAAILVALAIGVVAALAATRLLAAQLFGVSATDPLTFLVVPLVLAAVAAVACFVPARRASRVDPMIALRTD